MCSRFLRITVKTQRALYIPIAQNENEFTLLVHDMLQLRTGRMYLSSHQSVCVGKHLSPSVPPSLFYSLSFGRFPGLHVQRESGFCLFPLRGSSSEGI